MIDANLIKMLVGFCGRAGSGKDACADHLCNERGFIKYAFAEPLKKGCQILFGLRDDQIYGDSKEIVDSRYGKSPRQILQYIGTDVIRANYGEDFWIKHFKNFFEQQMQVSPIGDRNIVVSDIRFQNEVDTINTLGGVVYFIDRKRSDPQNISSSPRPGGFSSYTRTPFSGHVSEAAESLTGYDSVIHNHQSLGSLYQTIDDKLNLLKQRDLSESFFLHRQSQ